MAYIQMIQARNDTLCSDTSPCTCKTSDSLKVNINCHGKGLNISTVCRICAKVGHVQRLDVGDNGLSTIPSECFKHCIELEELHLDSNELAILTKAAFVGLTQLKRLNIDNNNLIKDGEIYDPELFKPLQELEELHIQNNEKKSPKPKSVTYLSNVVNDTLCNLQRLYLDGLPNGRFGSNFISFQNLSLISFAGSKIFNTTNDTFKNVPHVERLDMSYCNLTHVEAGTFEPLKTLKFLNLSNNMGLGFPSLRNISYGIRDSTSIESLDYSKVYKTFGLTTQLNRCDLWYLQNTTLKELHINSNRMAKIEIDALRLMPSTLERAYVNDNKLTLGPYALQVGCVTNLRHLELNKQGLAQPMDYFNYEIDIVENKIDTSGGCPVEGRPLNPNCWSGHHKPLRRMDFRLPYSLKNIGFSQSSLSYHPTLLKEPVYLKNSVKSFDLSNNLLTKWVDKLIMFDDLKHLNLSNNFCSNITGDLFTNCPNLQTFDASHNSIGGVLEKDIEGSIFRSVSGLRILNISACWIEKLPEKAFIHLSSLEHIDLSFNMLENISFHFKHMQKLSTLRLRQNKISTLPLNLLEQMKTFAARSGKNMSIDLSDNIIDAGNCNNFDFLEWMMKNAFYFSDIDTYKFYTNGHGPISFQKLKDTFSDKQKGCQTYIGLIIFASMFIMSMTSIIIIGIIYRYRWRLRYLYYMTKAKYHGYVPVGNTDTEAVYEYDVFISYATDDYKFVTGEMYNRLKETGLSMCLHQKDFLPGHDIAWNIVQAIRNSRITLVVLSPSFLESKWCIYEFNMARMESIYSREGENVLYTVMYHPINLMLASPEMRECFESESYSQYPETDEERPYFWQMLIRALGGR